MWRDIATGCSIKHVLDVLDVKLQLSNDNFELRQSTTSSKSNRITRALSQEFQKGRASSVYMSKPLGNI